MKNQTLSASQMGIILAEFHHQKSMLTDKEIQNIANHLNKTFNIPFINEGKEFVVFCKLVHWVDTFLYSVLPNEFYELIRNCEDGITEDEAYLIIERVTPLINKAINIPILNESAEKAIISVILRIIINALLKGNKL